MILIGGELGLAAKGDLWRKILKGSVGKGSVGEKVGGEWVSDEKFGGERGSDKVATPPRSRGSAKNGFR